VPPPRRNSNQLESRTGFFPATKQMRTAFGLRSSRRHGTEHGGPSKAINLSELESHLWEEANILCGPVDAADSAPRLRATTPQLHSRRHPPSRAFSVQLRAAFIPIALAVPSSDLGKPFVSPTLYVRVKKFCAMLPQCCDKVRRSGQAIGVNLQASPPSSVVEMSSAQTPTSITSASFRSSIDSDLASDRSVEISCESPMELATALVAADTQKRFARIRPTRT